MRVDIVNDNNISFKSGYPTFGSSGHLSNRPDVYDLVNFGFRPTGILKEEKKVDYLA